METQLELDIYKQLARYLSGESSLEIFRDWFDESTWNAEPEPNSAASQLIGEIELRLAEFSAGHWSESELRANLRTLVEARTHK